jgi:hypothetical protein
MRSYEVYDVMHMIPQRRIVTMDLDRNALYGIVAITILLGERGTVLVLAEGPSVSQGYHETDAEH